MTLAVVIGLAAATVVCKGLGPALRRVPDVATRWTKRLGPFLLAALVTAEIGGGGAKPAAVAVAALPITLGAPPLVSVLVGAATAALLRAV